MTEANMAAALKRLRAKKHITQKELAAMLGISRMAVALYELGRQTPTVKHLLAMADIFGCTTDELLGRGCDG